MPQGKRFQDLKSNMERLTAVRGGLPVCWLSAKQVMDVCRSRYRILRFVKSHNYELPIRYR